MEGVNVVEGRTVACLAGCGGFRIEVPRAGGVMGELDEPVVFFGYLDEGLRPLGEFGTADGEDAPSSRGGVTNLGAVAERGHCELSRDAVVARIGE